MNQIGLDTVIKKPVSAFRIFLNSEAAGGLILIAISTLAIAVANSPWSLYYFDFVHATIGPELTSKLGPMTVHLWINDGLMALFFLLVGLEIKREFVDGHLARREDRLLPVITAIAGMAIPAMIFLFLTKQQPDLARGWAIPAATDIAFAIAVLALLGSKAPASLKLLLATVAIVDDMGAILIIALFYTSSLNPIALSLAAALWLAMLLSSRRNVMALWPYLILAALLWYAILLSGVHATIAGVLAAVAIPLRRTIGAPDAEDSPLHRLEHYLARPVAFFIIPLFGFVNAGVSLDQFAFKDLLAPLPLGIALALFAGKQIGIFGSVWAVVRLGWAARPKNANWMQIYGVALLCGIGFTMSLFIGGLAFADTQTQDGVKLGVLMGSLASAVCGYAVLSLAARKGRARLPNQLGTKKDA
jgi:Na+:H+ antiporter, NhaA family